MASTSLTVEPLILCRARRCKKLPQTCRLCKLGGEPVLDFTYELLASVYLVWLHNHNHQSFSLHDVGPIRHLREAHALQNVVVKVFATHWCSNLGRGRKWSCFELYCDCWTYPPPHNSPGICLHTLVCVLQHAAPSPRFDRNTNSPGPSWIDHKLNFPHFHFRRGSKFLPNTYKWGMLAQHKLRIMAKSRNLEFRVCQANYHSSSTWSGVATSFHDSLVDCSEALQVLGLAASRFLPGLAPSPPTPESSTVPYRDQSSCRRRGPHTLDVFQRCPCL